MGILIWRTISEVGLLVQPLCVPQDGSWYSQGNSRSSALHHHWALCILPRRRFTQSSKTSTDSCQATSSAVAVWAGVQAFLNFEFFYVVGQGSKWLVRRSHGFLYAHARSSTTMLAPTPHIFNIIASEGDLETGIRNGVVPR